MMQVILGEKRRHNFVQQTTEKFSRFSSSNHILHIPAEAFTTAGSPEEILKFERAWIILVRQIIQTQLGF